MRYHAYPAGAPPCFSHLLIASTAPLEAERPYRSGMDLLHALALRGLPADGEPTATIQAGLQQHQISWISIPPEGSGILRR